MPAGRNFCLPQGELRLAPVRLAGPRPILVTLAHKATRRELQLFFYVFREFLGLVLLLLLHLGERREGAL